MMVNAQNSNDSHDTKIAQDNDADTENPIKVNILGDAGSAAPVLLTIKQVSQMVSLSRASIYRLMVSGTPRFPRPVKIGAASRWVHGDILNWVFAAAAQNKRT